MDALNQQHWCVPQLTAEFWQWTHKALEQSPSLAWTFEDFPQSTLDREIRSDLLL
jgi:hypothetical protein